MRIGFVTTGFPRFKGDFAGNFVYHMAEGFAQRGYQIDVVVPEPLMSQPTTWRNSSAWPPWLEIHPVSYIRPKSLQQLFFLEGAPENLSANRWRNLLIPPAVSALWNRVDALAPRWSGVISHWLLPSAMIAPRTTKISLPHLAIAHSGDVHLLKQLPGSAVTAALIAKRANAVSFVSKQLKTEFSMVLPPHHKYQQRLHVTPMGISSIPINISRVEARKKYCINGWTALYVGRLTPIKGVDKLIDAAHRGGFHPLIAGDGECRPELEQQCRQNGIHATFLGAVSPKVRNELFRAADVLVVPSIPMPDGRHEGVPMVIAEAMAAGIPIVASQTGGIEELITHQHTGLLVPPGEASEIHRSVVQIERAPALAKALQAAAAQRIKERFWPKLIPKYEELLFNAH